MSIWEDEANVGILQRMWEEGVSAREIADRLGATKNSVIGKANRLGLPRHKKAGRPSNPLLRRSREKPKVVRMFAPGVSFQSLQNGHCRWPIQGQGKDMICCGAPRTKGSSYCEDHEYRSINHEHKRRTAAARQQYLRQLKRGVGKPVIRQRVLFGIWRDAVQS